MDSAVERERAKDAAQPPQGRYGRTAEEADARTDRRLKTLGAVLGVLLLGYRVMQLNGYLRSHLSGRERSPVSFGLICPGVALFVMGMFWWHLVWVGGGLNRPFGAAYWAGIALLALVALFDDLGDLRLGRLDGLAAVRFDEDAEQRVAVEHGLRQGDGNDHQLVGVHA